MSLKQIEIVPYNPRWSEMYEAEALKIRHILGTNFYDIHHIGSTSIPKISAKDRIDILCTVNNLSDSLCLSQLGYEFKGELNIPLRYYFSKHTPALKVNLHVVKPGHGFIELNLCFRDYLRQNVPARLAYEKLKLLLLKDPTSFERSNGGFANYTLHKNDFIKSILRQANFKGITINFCTHYAEWDAYHRIKEIELFNPILRAYDRYHPHTTATHHYHFVMYSGVEIVCIAHIELLNNEVAVLRALATDAFYKRQGYGTRMLTFLEQWVAHQKRSVIQLHSDSSTEHFYRKFGYVETEFNDSSILKERLNMGKYLTF